MCLHRQTIGIHLTHRVLGGNIAIDRDALRRLTLMPYGLAEKELGRSYVARRPEHEVRRLADTIHRAVQVDPLTTNLEIGLVDTPQATCMCSKAAPAFVEFGRMQPHSAQNRRVRERETRFGHHLDQIALVEPVAQVSASTRYDDFPIKMASNEQLRQTLQLALRESSACFARTNLTDSPTLFLSEPKSAVRTGQSQEYSNTRESEIN